MTFIYNKIFIHEIFRCKCHLMTHMTLRNWTHGNFDKNVVGARGLNEIFFNFYLNFWWNTIFYLFQITQQLKEIAGNVVNGDISERAALFQSITGIVEGEGIVFFIWFLGHFHVFRVILGVFFMKIYWKMRVLRQNLI